ncbi:hypothetical protein JHK85_002376 [Glycine max]|nr:hypothetical protein JHK85_002376 [Glycine max]KAG5089704.1 hypothetical protein JHK86_002316 [Glycine max]
MITTHTSTNLSLETVLGISIKEKHGDMGNKRDLIFVLNGILIEASLFKTLPDLFVFGRRGSRSSSVKTIFFRALSFSLPTKRVRTH